MTNTRLAFFFSQQTKVWLGRIGTAFAVMLIGYVGNQGVQSYFGHSALASTGLEIHSLEQALSLAQQQNKRVLADMSAIWCPTCRRLDKKVFADASVKQELEAHFVFARIEYDSAEGEAFMHKYGVHGFPTLLILDGEGNKLSQLPIIFDPTQFKMLLEMVG